MLHSCDVGRRVDVSELGGFSLDFVVFMCFEALKWEEHGCHNENKLHFDAKSVSNLFMITKSTVNG